jgi:hypothetical protein|tara:strand:- start:3460 stop:3714 length:255 start_codon:yes stop_codon:yes gene_type:complete
MGLIGYLVSNIIISILVIYIFHCIWNYIINKFSTKKKKDMVNGQISKYNKLIEDIKNNPVSKKDEFTDEMKVNLEQDLSEFIDL